MDQQTEQTSFIDLAADIVAAFVSHNRVQPADLPSLISAVHQALTTASAQGAGEPAEPEQPKVTPQQIRKSITADHLVSFEDGKRYRTLRRHLTMKGLTPQTYREKWGLPADYPMIASSYSRQRSELAKALGLGQQRRNGLAKVSAPDALRVKAFEVVAESPAGGVSRDDATLVEVAVVPEATRPTGKSRRAAAPKAGKRKVEPAEA